MIHKITGNEYLKRYDNMTEDEKLKLAERVGGWLDFAPKLLIPKADEPLARMQDVMQVSIGWNDSEQSLFCEGVKLMTAFTGITDTWLPKMIYTKSARRSIRKIIEVLAVCGKKLLAAPVSAPDRKAAAAKPISVVVTGEQIAKAMTGRNNVNSPISALQSDPPSAPERPMEGKRKRGRPRKSQLPTTAQQQVQALPKSTAAGQQAPNANTISENISRPKLNNNLTTLDAMNVVPRPKHIDQYAYLLPASTQQKAVQYGPLMRDLQSARENMRLLMNDQYSSDADRERWAKLAVKIDNRIGDIRKELDAEWNKVVATGRVFVDSLGMAHILDSNGNVADPKPIVNLHHDDAKPKGDPKPKKKCPKPMTEEEKAKRITYLQKWLRDARPTASEDHRKQWEQNARELIRLGGNLTDAMCKTGEHYSAKIPKVKAK